MNYKLYKNDFPATLNFKKMVAIDTETMGLNLNRDRVCLVQVCFGDDIAHLVQLSKPNKEKPKNLIKLLQDKTITKIFHYERNPTHTNTSNTYKIYSIFFIYL